MQITTLPLGQIHPSWRGSLIPSAFDALTHGIERERIRLFGLSFLTLTFRQEYDYDGLTEYLHLLEGFSDEATAIHYVEQLTEQTLSASLAEPSYGNYKWRHDTSRDNERFKAKHESSLVRCRHLTSFKILNDSGYDSKYFQFEVLRVNHPAVLGPDLFTYYDAESEWVAYFISKGED
jgi:hypothetical protein